MRLKYFDPVVAVAIESCVLLHQNPMPWPLFFAAGAWPVGDYY